MTHIINLDESESNIFFDKDVEFNKFIQSEKDEMVRIHQALLKRIDECEASLKIAWEVKNLWNDENLKREARITFQTNWTFDDDGFSISLSLAEHDSIKSVSNSLRPIKYCKFLLYKGPFQDKQNGIVGADYKIATCRRSLAVRIILSNSNTCRQVKVGEKLVPIYEVRCEDPKDIKELESIDSD